MVCLLWSVKMVGWARLMYSCGIEGRGEGGGGVGGREPW